MSKLKAKLPRGFVDKACSLDKDTVAKLSRIADLYGFDYLDTPVVEYSDCLGEDLPKEDRVFSFKDNDDQSLSLRYDLTASLARYVAENVNTINLPLRTYRSGSVFRNESTGPNRFRQFTQFDVDTVGAYGPASDAEMIMMMCDSLEAIGLKNYIVKVSSRSLFEAVLDTLEIVDLNQRDLVLRSLDKLDRVGLTGVTDLLSKGRKDSSGDFTVGANLSYQQIELICDFLQQNFSQLYKASEQFCSSMSEISKIIAICRDCGYADSKVRFCPSIVRGLSYYTGCVFEASINGTNASIGGGGRYDNLVKKFTGQKVPAVGFSIGISRVASFVKQLKEPIGPVLVTVMQDTPQSICFYQTVVDLLRSKGIRAELFQGNKKNFSKQLSYADKRNCPLVIIQGEAEQKIDSAIIKDMRVSYELDSRSFVDKESWRSAKIGEKVVLTCDLYKEVKSMLQENTQ